MLGNVMKGGWKDDRQSQLKRTEARWPWRTQVLARAREFAPKFPQATFDRRWTMVQVALEALHDADPAPHRPEEMAAIILGENIMQDDRHAAAALVSARRLARRYFAPYDHFFSWLEP